MQKHFWAFLTLALLLTACHPATAGVTDIASPPAAAVTAVPSDTPTQLPLAALVNGEGILLQTYQDELARLQDAQSDLSPAPDAESQASRVMDYLIDQTLLAQAAQEAGYQPDEAAVEQRIAALTEGLGETSLDAWLSAHHYTLDTFKQDLTRDLAAAWMRDKIIAGVPTEAEQVHLFQIMLYNEEEADQVWRQLAAGEDFETLARRYDPTTGGDLGWVPQHYLLEPALDEAAFALAPGEYSAVLTSSVGYHILYVKARETRALSPDALLVWQQQALDNWLADRRAQSDIRFAP